MTDSTDEPIADGGIAAQEGGGSTGPEPLYPEAKRLDLNDYYGWRVERFVEALLDETDYTDEAALNAATAEVYGSTYHDDELQLLLVYPDEIRQYVGEDETAKDANQLFSFFIDPAGGDPAVRTTEEALNMLKPAGVRDRITLGEDAPQRQGEWWLLEDAGEPESRLFKPGVAERPFGESPLINHVPREYGLGVTADVFVERFRDACPSLAEFVDTPMDAFQKIRQAQELQASDDIELTTPVISEQRLYDLAEGVYVRGTLRHRSNEHYMETVGEDWKLAVTHGVDVWTVDSFQLTNETSATVRFD